jgi:hypothetical protein
MRHAGCRNTFFRLVHFHKPNPTHACINRVRGNQTHLRALVDRVQYTCRHSKSVHAMFQASSQAIVVITCVPTNPNNVRLRNNTQRALSNYAYLRTAGQTTWEISKPGNPIGSAIHRDRPYSNLPSIAPRGEPGVILPEGHQVRCLRLPDLRA